MSEIQSPYIKGKQVIDLAKCLICKNLSQKFKVRLNLKPNFINCELKHNETSNNTN